MKLSSRFCHSFFWVGFFLLFLVVPQQALSATFQELWGSEIFTSANSWTDTSVQDYFAAGGYDLTLSEAASIIAAEDSGNVDAAFQTLVNKFAPTATASTAATTVASAIGGAGGATAAAAYVAPAAATARFVFSDLVLPEPPTRIQIQTADLETAFSKTRSFGSTGRVQMMDFDGAEDGNLYGINFSLVQDVGDNSYGGAFAYEYMDFDTVSVEQNNLILFLQHNMPLASNLTGAVTGHVNYIYSYVDFAKAGSRSVNTAGLGLSGSATYDNDDYISTFGLSYSFNHDDTNSAADDKHLVKAGTIQGLRQGDHNVYDVSLVYNLDLTDYENVSGTNDYYELGARFRRDFSDSWSCTVGYKKILGLSGFDSNEFILGSNWRF